MIPNFDIKKIKVRLSKTSAEVNLRKLRENSNALNYVPSTVLDDRPRRLYTAKSGFSFIRYGLIASDRFNPSALGPNEFPKNFRWIDRAQYNVNRLKGVDWGIADFPNSLPPAYMVLEKMKYWPPRSPGYMTGERYHDDVMLDIVENYFLNDEVLPSIRNKFFIGSMKDLDLKSINNMSAMLIMDNVKELNNYPFTRLRPLAYYENDLDKIKFMKKIGMKAESPKLKTYDARHHNIRDHIALFVSSLIDPFVGIYSNYPLDELYPHVFEVKL